MKRFTFLLLFLFFLFFTVKGQFPYEYKSQTDLSIAGSVIGLGLSSMYFHLRDTCLSDQQIETLDPLSINQFDRSATKKWSPFLSRVSDAGLLLCMTSPVFLLASSDIRKTSSVYTLMAFENLFLTMVFTGVTKTTTLRIRPYTYNAMVPYHEKVRTDARRSFISGHTSLAFCSAVFLSSVFSKTHPDSPLRPLVWSSSLLCASGVGYLRYASGKHFPTDIIAGAIVGSTIGYCIPALHEIKTKKQTTGKYFVISFHIPL